MTSAHEPPLADYLPPSKRPRVDNPQLHTLHNAIPGPAGPSTVAVPDQDGGADAASKKNRKRPLSCGECRRYASLVFLPLQPLIRALLVSRLKLKVRPDA